MAEVTITYVSKRPEISITEAQRVATWLERIGADAKPCPRRDCRRPNGHSGRHYYDEADALPAGVQVDKNRTFKTGQRNGQDYIHCLVCEMTSFHPEDIRQRYCGSCHQFHEILRQRSWAGQV